jgi:voltage-gated potassium channel
MLPGTEAAYGRPAAGWRRRLYEIVFESETAAGRAFDQALVVVIALSVAVVVADSVPSLQDRFGHVFDVAEWCFTVLFTVEYIARLACVERPLRYARSFFGLVDLVSVLPTYLAFFLPQTSALINVRTLRLLRIFRIFKLSAYLAEYQLLAEALAASRRKILVFLSVVLMVALILGTLLYVVEGPEHGFLDIPTAIYWSITTITTVGFGDITPKTGVGRFIASVMMLIGWGTLAVPTGIVTAEISARTGRSPMAPRICPECAAVVAAPDARYCQHCGTALPPLPPAHG